MLLVLVLVAGVVGAGSGGWCCWFWSSRLMLLVLVLVADVVGPGSGG